MSMFFMVYFPFYNTKIQIIFQLHNFFLIKCIYMCKIKNNTMKRILISEDEKQRILGMHVDKGYTSVINEQPTPPAPISQPKKGTELNTQYFTMDPTGKVLSVNPAFVKFIQDNNINIKQANLQLQPNNSQAIIKGGDGKTILVNFSTFDGNIPADVTQQYTTALNQVRDKVNQLNSDPQNKQNLCFDVTLMRKNDKGNQVGCKTAWNDFDTFVKSTNYESLNSLRQMKNFLDFAPRWKTA